MSWQSDQGFEWPVWLLIFVFAGILAWQAMRAHDCKLAGGVYLWRESECLRRDAIRELP